MVRDALRAELDAAVDEAAGAFELPLQREVEVRERLRRREEIVLLLRPLQCPRDQRAVRDPPDTAGVSFPSGEGPAVEERNARLGAGKGDAGGKQENEALGAGHRGNHTNCRRTQNRPLTPKVIVVPGMLKLLIRSGKPR